MAHRVLCRCSSAPATSKPGVIPCNCRLGWSAKTGMYAQLWSSVSVKSTSMSTNHLPHHLHSCKSQLRTHALHWPAAAGLLVTLDWPRGSEVPCMITYLSCSFLRSWVALVNVASSSPAGISRGFTARINCIKALSCIKHRFMLVVH